MLNTNLGEIVLNTNLGEPFLSVYFLTHTVYQLSTWSRYIFIVYIVKTLLPIVPVQLIAKPFRSVVTSKFVIESKNEDLILVIAQLPIHHSNSCAGPKP